MEIGSSFCLRNHVVTNTYFYPPLPPSHSCEALQNFFFCSSTPLWEDGEIISDSGILYMKRVLSCAPLYHNWTFIFSVGYWLVTWMNVHCILNPVFDYAVGSVDSQGAGWW